MLTAILAGTGVGIAVKWVLDGLIARFADTLVQSLDSVTTNLLETFGLDYGLFFETFPFLNSTMNIIRDAAFALAMILAITQLVAVFFGSMAKSEHPMMTIGRFALSFFGISFSKQIVDFVLNIAQQPFNQIIAVDNAGVTKEALVPWGGNFWNYLGGKIMSFKGFSADRVFSNSVAGLVITIFLVGFLAWHFFKLMLEIVERYVVLGILCCCSPLGFATAASGSTINVFKAYCRMFISECVVIILNAWFVRGFIMAAGNWAVTVSNEIAASLPSYLMLLAYLIACTHLDRYLNQLGLNTIQTGGMLAAEVAIAGRTFKGGLDKTADAFTGKKGGIWGAMVRGARNGINNMGLKKGSSISASDANVGGVMKSMNGRGVFAVLGGNASEQKKMAMGTQAAFGESILKGQSTQKQLANAGHNMNDIARSTMPLLHNARLHKTNMHDGGMETTVRTATGDVKFAASRYEGQPLEKGQFLVRSASGDVFVGSLSGNDAAVSSVQASMLAANAAIMRANEEAGHPDAGGLLLEDNPFAQSGINSGTEANGADPDSENAQNAMNGTEMEGDAANEGIANSFDMLDGMNVSAGRVGVDENGNPFMEGIATMENGESTGFRFSKLDENASEEEKAAAIVDANGDRWSVTTTGAGMDSKNNYLTSSGEAMFMQAADENARLSNLDNLAENINNGTTQNLSEAEQDRAATALAEAAGIEGDVAHKINDDGSFEIQNENGDSALLGPDGAAMVSKDGQERYAINEDGDSVAALKEANSADFVDNLLNGSQKGVASGEDVDKYIAEAAGLDPDKHIENGAISNLNDGTRLNGTITDDEGNAISNLGLQKTEDGTWRATSLDPSGIAPSMVVDCENAGTAAATAAASESDQAQVAKTLAFGSVNDKDIPATNMYGDGANKILNDEMNGVEGTPGYGRYENGSFHNGGVDATFRPMNGTTSDGDALLGAPVSIHTDTDNGNIKAESDFGGGTTVEGFRAGNDASGNEAAHRTAMDMAKGAVTSDTVESITNGNLGNVVISGGAVNEMMNDGRADCTFSEGELSENGIHANVSSVRSDGTMFTGSVDAASETDSLGQRASNFEVKDSGGIVVGQYSMVGNDANIGTSEAYNIAGVIASGDTQSISDEADAVFKGQSSVAQISGDSLNGFVSETLGDLPESDSVSNAYVGDGQISGRITHDDGSYDNVSISRNEDGSFSKFTESYDSDGSFAGTNVTGYNAETDFFDNGAGYGSDGMPLSVDAESGETVSNGSAPISPETCGMIFRGLNKVTYAEGESVRGYAGAVLGDPSSGSSTIDSTGAETGDYTYDNCRVAPNSVSGTRTNEDGSYEKVSVSRNDNGGYTRRVERYDRDGYSAGTYESKGSLSGDNISWSAPRQVSSSGYNSNQSNVVNNMLYNSSSKLVVSSSKTKDGVTTGTGFVSSANGGNPVPVSFRKDSSGTKITNVNNNTTNLNGKEINFKGKVEDHKIKKPAKKTKSGNKNNRSGNKRRR